MNRKRRERDRIRGVSTAVNKRILRPLVLRLLPIIEKEKRLARHNSHMQGHNSLSFNKKKGERGINER